MKAGGMRILIVDDQSYVVSGIIDGVAWDKIGVTHIAEAYSGSQAIQILKEEKIDLLITDIQMPGMSGLELAEWAAAYDENIGIVFLTSHDSFDYAQTAIKIGCYDYILQPVDYRKLENAIRTVLEKMQEKRNQAILYESGRRWETLREDMIQNFWRKIILNQPSYSPRRIEEELQRIDYKLDWQQKYQLVLIHVLSQRQTLDDWRDAGIDARIEEEICSLKTLNPSLVCALKMDADQWLCVFQTSDLIPGLQLFVETEREHQFKVACYLSQEDEIYHLSVQYQNVCSMAKANVALYPGIFEYQNAHWEESSGNILEISDAFSSAKWKQMIRDGKEEVIKKEIRQFLEEKKRKESLNRNTLLVLQQLLLNTIYSLYRIDETKLLHVMGAPELSSAYLRSVESMDMFLQFADLILQKSREYNDHMERDDGEALVKKIKQYIAEHMDSKLSRSEIADHFFMSKDYITHQFKKYEGISLIQYINEQKLDMAKDLLGQTNIPVNVVAMKVGIPNYAYFSKIFREYTGVTAIEYRNNQKVNKKD